ncbi:hypothetical protein OIE43_02370 [Streptomyces pseudovenezuelae]|uniref:hypothetical protein n=1 Tax=Streptomyces pseudovenezuelae TaxID=67350 RepID=UPI002E3485E7|nr:hypothetical protein [Streptomyces pseudovenezuelae]
MATTAAPSTAPPSPSPSPSPPERIVATAELAAFLPPRLRQLAAPARESGQPDDAGRWTRTADATQAVLLPDAL